MAPERSEGVRVENAGLRALAWIPGMGQLLQGKRGRGVRQMTYALALVSLLVWRWDLVIGAFSSPFWDRWLASLTLIGALAALVALSRRDALRIAARTAETRMAKDPLTVALRRFRENRLAVAAVRVIVLFYLVAAMAPLVAPFDPAAIPDVATNRYLPPSWTHLFGTDEFGRDLFSRALYGARVSLSVGLLAMVIAKVTQVNGLIFRAA